MDGVYLDLYRKLQVDSDFKQKVLNIASELNKAEETKDTDKKKALLMQMLKLCDYNTALLVPYFFPNFDEGKPLSLMGRPYAFSVMSNTANTSLTLQASRQVGKCLADDTMLTVVDVSNNKHKTTIKNIFLQAKAVNKN